ncbi:DNA replication/repair protein RecF [Pseudolysinimonas kribbensis]|uniref:DNA replication and repair protein RecF n=1 Tax=Pseudolysinimonas kribbensis TaxID=433641 RepID=A0ABQ6K3E7_9MICO|nr:DNA replication/repair protein RecF [Pseudolysinimonas kribbensis]GMA95160.1 DNA replication and repair protein RecF [Pseudolysinimonas kribbensis]
MIVAHLGLTDFRNYAAADLELAGGPNVFVGRNGQGKTNLVEALGYLSTLGSHRVSTDQALIRTGSDAAIVRARLEHGGRDVLIELQINRSGANRAQVNRVATKPRELPRYITTVLFAPEDLVLVRGEPSARRRFLDELLVQTAPRFAGVIADYERVLKQRNSLLKSARGVRNPELSTLELWDERLVELGAEIIDARADLTQRLAPEVAAAYTRIAGDEHRAELGNALSILSDAVDEEVSDPASARLERPAIAEAFRAALVRLRRAELERGLTLAGPHRDDLVLMLNGLPARGYASHGESWSFALALRLASAAVLRLDSPLGDPIIILDDVFAELDETRRGQLAAAVGEYEQVLVTAAVVSDVPPEFAGRMVRIEAGAVLE